jgi:DNA processing protein
MQPVTLTLSSLSAGDEFHELVAAVALVRNGVLRGTRLVAEVDAAGSAVRVLQSEGALGMRDAVLDREQFSIPLQHEQSLEVDAADVAAWLARGYSATPTFHPAYPGNLLAVFDRPLLLFRLGQWLEDRDSTAVAVVGSRSASIAGQKRAYRLASDLVGANITVLSGMALGIDAAAHRGAMDARGRTVAVMGTGLDHRYPAAHRELANAIVASGGALVSQFLPPQRSDKWTFPVRNKTMSGLSVATVVVEAGSTSGARLQAQAALEHGRSVFLPTSLVENHEWAREMVTVGRDGNTAIELHSSDELIDRIQSASVEDVVF